MGIQNNLIVRKYKNLSQLRADIRKKKAAIKRITKSLDAAEDLLADCECLWKVIDGIALYHHNGAVGAIDKTITGRCAGYYVNANDNDWWGLKTYDYSFAVGFRNDEQFHGANWPTEKDVLQASIDWVTKGIIPKLPVEYQI